VSVNKFQQYLCLSKHGYLQHVGISNVQLQWSDFTNPITYDVISVCWDVPHAHVNSVDRDKAMQSDYT